MKQGDNDYVLARVNFMTPEQCSQQFEMYAKSHPSADSAHSLRFCAQFLRDYCIKIESK